MSYRYNSHQVHEFLQKPKCLSRNDTLELQSAGSHGGLEFKTYPQFIDGPVLDMCYLGKAPILNDITSYDASFLIEKQRVRGIGYTEVERKNLRFKKRKSKGWHLNVCDPSLPTNDLKRNIHQPLPDFSVTDFHDFIRQTADMWKIDLDGEWNSDLL